MEIATIILVVVLILVIASQGVIIINYRSLEDRVDTLEKHAVLTIEREGLMERRKDLNKDFDKMLSSLVNAGECDCENCNPSEKRNDKDINEMIRKMFKEAETVKVRSCNLEDFLSAIKKEEKNEEKRKTSTEKKGDTNDQDKHEDQGKA